MTAPLRRFGRYELIAELGRGGMGMVFRARDAVSGRQVALKVLGGESNPKSLERFRREGELTAALSHPGIVRIHDAGTEQGRPFLAYELIEGRTLEEAFAELDRGVRLQLVAEAADAVAHAHQAGIVHRDLKPENILVDQEDRAHVADFGLAWISGQERLTRTHGMVGTPFYMAPEQFDGAAAPSCDVWSLGVLLYRALTDELPFRAGTMVELASQIQKGAFAPPRDLDPTIPPPLEAVCLTALQRDTERRYPTATELAKDLQAALAGRPVSASASSLRLRAALRQRRGPILMGVVLLAALGLVVFAVARGSSTPKAAPKPDGPNKEVVRASRRLAEALTHIEAGEPEKALALLGDEPASLPLRCEALVAAGRLEDARLLLPSLSPSQQAVATAELERAKGDDAEPRLRVARERWPDDPAILEALARHLILVHEARMAHVALADGKDVPDSPRLKALRHLIETLLDGKVPAEPHPLGKVAAESLIHEAREQIALGHRFPDSRRPRAERWKIAKTWLNQAYALADRKGPLAGKALAGLCSLIRFDGKRVAAPTIEQLRGFADDDPHVAAELCFHQAMRDAKVALKDLRRGSQMTSEGHLARAMALLHSGRTKKVLGALRRHGHRDDRRRLTLLASLAGLLRKPKLVARANNGLRWLDDPDPTVDARASELRRKRVEPRKMIEKIQPLVEEFPLAPMVRYVHALGLLDQNDVESGLVEFVALFNDRPELYGREGVFHLREVSKVEETGLAISPLRAALGDRLERDDADPYIRGFLCSILSEYTVVEQDPRWVDIGLADLNQVVRLEPTALFARLLRAHLWLRKGRWERAHDDLNRVADVFEQHGTVWFYRARMLAVRKRPLKEIVGLLRLAKKHGYSFPDAGLAGRLYPELRPYLKNDELQKAEFWRSS